jgi:hypothetical protein
MPPARDLPDQFRALIRDPIQHKESSPGFVPGEQVEDGQRVLLDPRLEAVPLRGLNQAAERADLKIVFEQDCQQVLLDL